MWSYVLLLILLYSIIFDPDEIQNSNSKQQIHLHLVFVEHRALINLDQGYRLRFFPAISYLSLRY